MNNETPSFYAIIPAFVRYSKKLIPSAKLLYGELTALCNKEGYCWASNAYLANLYDVDITTIQRWLESLKDEGFISVELEKSGMQTTRKIWIVNEIKIISPTPQKRGADTAETRCRDRKNAVPINTKTNTSNKSSPIPSSKPEPKKAKPPLDDDGDPLIVSFRKAKLDDDQIARAVTYYNSNPEVQSKTNPIGYCVYIVRNNQDMIDNENEEIIEKRKLWAKSSEYNTGCGYMSACKEGVEKVSGSIRYFYKYNSRDAFWDYLGLSLKQVA